MEFDNKIFKKHYGKIYLDILKIDIILCAVLIIVYLLAYFIKNVDERTMINIVYAIVIFVCISMVFIVPATVFSYLSALNRSKRQQQYYSKGRLIYEPGAASGFKLGGGASDSQRYEINHISNISYTRRYIIIEGSIQLISNKSVTNCETVKIPINFTDYDKI